MKLMTPAHRKLLFTLVLCGAGILAFGLNRLHWRTEAAIQKNQSSSDELWQELAEAAATQQEDPQRKPPTARTLRLNQEALTRLLSQAPMEYTEAAQRKPVSIALPMPDGSFAKFRLEESPISAPSPDGSTSNFRAYRGQGIDDPTLTARFDWSPLGFHAIILSSQGTIYIQPAVKGETATYVTQLGGSEPGSFQCGVSEVEMAAMEARRLRLQPNVVSGATLRVYRLAIAATAEFTQQYGGGNVENTLNAIKTTVNLINAIYQQDLSIKLVLVSDNQERSIIFTNTLTDGYTDDGNGENPDADALLNENEVVLAASGIVYDIGHVFGGIVVPANSSSFSGVATLGVVCDTGKARGASTLGGGTTGDDIFVRGIAHEFGHQFSANHTFNATTNAFCAGQRSALSAYEPGSGSTLMGYSVCRTSNTDTEVLQRPNNSYLHNHSLEQIITYANTATCNQANWVATGNTPPTVNAGANFTIPANTPFALTATGNDADNDPLTYGWEQFDLGAAGPPNTDNGDRPIFRSYLPASSPVRNFPSLQYILNNANNPPTFYQCGTNNQGPISCLTGESLAVTNRTMNFRVTARDNRAMGGGINSAAMQVTVVANAGPFNVTQPNTAVNWTGGTNQTVTWNVAGTTAAPISAANVKLSLSTDGGQTFPIVIAATTPNDGSQSITVPNVNTTTARLKVEAVGNIFFDISDANFTIVAGACPPVTISPTQLPNGVLNTAYNQTLTASGGTAPYTYTLDAGVIATNRFDATGPVNIPDNNAAGVDLPITVTGMTAPLSKVTVSLQIDHTFVRDLRLQLISPDNTTINLAVNRGPQAATVGYGTACNPDASRTTFDDAAATMIANGVAPFEGTFKPEQLLAAFNGKSGAAVNGQWKLHVVDSAGDDVGTINCVSLMLTQAQAAPGLSLAANGTLSGTLTTASTFNFTVKATDAGGCMGTQAYALTINAAGACPTVNNLNPTSGPAGSQVVITGTNFTGVNGVKFTNNVAATFNVDSVTQITATVPAGAITGPLTISKTGCNDVQTANFTVTVPQNCPTATGLNPMNGVVGGLVIITGTNFTGVNAVKFSNNVTATFTVNSATQITATIPNGAVTGPITISKTGCADVQTASFTVCTGAAQLLQVDNNAYNSSDTVLQSAQTYFVNRLTPTSYPATLSQVLLRFDFVQAGEPITIVVAPNPTGSTNINNLTFQTVNVTAPGGAGVGDPVLLDPYNVPAITINSGDFVVGFGLTSNNVGNISPMSADNNVPPAGRSYKAGSLTTFNQPVEKNYFIRARYLTGCGGGSSNGLQFYPLAAPVRLLDTRPGASPNACSQPNAPITGQTSRTQPGRNLCNIPANAQALTGNVTTVDSGGGFLTLYPSDAQQPTVASTNYGVNEIINNVFTVGLGADGAFKIFANTTTDVVVDVTGYYAPPGAGGLYFHPLPAPVRLLETRPGLPVGCVKPGVPLTGNAESTQQAISACTGIPAAARAIVGNATTVGPQGGGFLTIFPADAVRPLVAASNFNTGQVVNGPFSVGLAANGQFKIYTTSTTDLVVDVLGYYSSEANDANGAGLLFTPLARPVRLLETRPGLPVGCFKPGVPLTGGSETPQTARGTCDGVTIPANALGVVGNATVVFPSGAGFLTLWPSSAARPLVATSNYNAGDVGNRHFIVGLGNVDGAFKIYTHATSHLVIDLSGYFAP
jgi:subtilisin-like proprotein convertase family protein